jgi:hypothetical protein
LAIGFSLSLNDHSSSYCSLSLSLSHKTTTIYQTLQLISFMLLLAASEYFYYTPVVPSHQKSTCTRRKATKLLIRTTYFSFFYPANGIADSTVKQTCIYLFVFSVCTSSVYGWMERERDVHREMK